MLKILIIENILTISTVKLLSWSKYIILQRVLSTECHYYSKIVQEAIKIKKSKTSKREDRFKLSPTWNRVIKMTKPLLNMVSIEYFM